MISKASFNEARPGERASRPPRTARSKGESRGAGCAYAPGVGGGGSAGAALHQGWFRNSSIVYRCAGSTHSKCVIRSLAGTDEYLYLKFLDEHTDLRHLLDPTKG